MISNYLSSLILGSGNNTLDIMNITSDETEKVKQFLRNEISGSDLIASADLGDALPLRYFDGIEATLTEQYENHHLYLLELYGEESSVSLYEVDGGYNFSGIPYDVFDSWIVVISSVPFNDLKTNPSLLDTEFLVAYGMKFEGYDDDDYGNIDIPEINPLDYIESLTINNGQTDISSAAVDRSVFVEEMFSDGINVLTNGMYSPTGDVYSLELSLKPEYQDYYMLVYRAIEYQGYLMPIDAMEDVQSPIVIDTSGELPYSPVAYDNFIFMLSPVSFEYLEDFNSIVAFGVGFGVSTDEDEDEDEPDIDLPPEPINPEQLSEGQFVEVLDGTTLEHYSYVPDVYNVKVAQAINGYHTLSFNLQPYVNASNIYTPRIIHVDNDYFHVQQITKRHHLGNLEMDVLCEHVSYELNYPPPKSDGGGAMMLSSTDEEEEEYEWTEDTYQGTASEILWELLQYNNRFDVGTVDNDMTVHTFTTKGEGFRTRINEFAEFVGLEVRWNKFTVSLLRKRGRDHGLTFEIGKNIIELTEVITTIKLGKVERSYELDVLDLNYVYDSNDAPLELHNIALGDAVTIINPNYRIQRKDRIVSITRDPFKKALPTIEFGNKLSSFTSDNKSGAAVGSALNLPIYQENITRGSRGNAFGQDTISHGDWSFAEGYSTRANGLYSHSEGYYTSAWGNGSHAEGGMTNAEGYRSHAEGSSTTASGDYSHSEGVNSQANGNFSHAEGISTMADGDGSHSSGASTVASGTYSYAQGYGCVASSYTARATGYNTQATANYSSAKGSHTIASGDSAQASGLRTQATARHSQAHGLETVASGERSSAFGHGTLADRGNGFAIGKYNKPFWSTGDSNWAVWEYTDVFLIGNGIGDTTRSNALRISYNGNMYIQGAYNTTGADYSEYFEWSDGNSNADDRKGYVVTFEGDKIRLAKADDNYILGIVSVNPSVIGNSYQDQWQGMYVTDEWGNIEYHYTDVPYKEPDENGEIKTVYRQSYVPKLNPNYNSEQTYTPRSERPEWSTVGMLGKLLVRDDGTCEINKYAKVSETVDGILSHSDERTQFFVLRRINENLVEVLIK